MPRFFYTKKYFTYSILFLLSLGFFITASILSWSVFSVFLFGNHDIVHGGFINQSIVGSIIGITCITMMIKLAKRGIEVDKRNEELEKEKLNTELKFLKSQLNPHFLFNALNSIYFLIKKDPDQAADALADFSEMLQYQIYDCNDSKISLQKEVEYMENFVRISKLRKSGATNVEVKIDEKINGELVAPLLLIPFVENAFKHVSSHTDRANWIKVDLKLQDKELFFEVENTVDEQDQSQDALKIGGLGLPNVQRRLDLLYPQKHELDIFEEDEKFKVKLKLNLN